MGVKWTIHNDTASLVRHFHPYNLEEYLALVREKCPQSNWANLLSWSDISSKLHRKQSKQTGTLFLHTACDSFVLNRSNFVDDPKIIENKSSQFHAEKKKTPRLSHNISLLPMILKTPRGSNRWVRSSGSITLILIYPQVHQTLIHIKPSIWTRNQGRKERHSPNTRSVNWRRNSMLTITWPDSGDTRLLWPLTSRKDRSVETPWL